MSKTIKDTNALEISDEDFMNNASSFEDTDLGTVDDEDHDESASDTSVEADKPVDDGDGTDETDTTDSDNEKDAGNSSDGSDGDDTTIDSDDTDASNKADDKDNQTSAEELTAEQYAEVGRRIMGEFKANGTMMKVKSVEDALQLMQMGANYHKKMTGLKPSLKTLKLLENNDLLDLEKLNYLIDLSQKKPEAIKKLLKDSNLDPLQIDLEEENNYVPAKRTVSDTEMALEEVLNNISDSPSYDKTLTVLSEKWDDASRRAVADNPQIIGVINAHMDSGIFDQVANAVAYERSLGKLVGVSELDAYQRIGAYMHENNMFKGAAVQQQQKVQPMQQDPQPQNLQNTQQDDERKNRKKAASPSRQGSASVKKDDNYNPLAMSDEEFAKLNNLSL